MKVATYVNAHKALVIPLVLGMMWFRDNWSTEAFIYLGIHGTYALLWLIKQSLYPDGRFNEKQPLWIGALFIFLPLAGYYIAPYLLISRHITLPPYVIGLVLALYTAGIFLHYVSDAQKYYTLQLRKGLIQEGLFSRTRNPKLPGGDIDIHLLCDDVVALAPIPDPGRMGVWFLHKEHACEGCLAFKIPGIRAIQEENGVAASETVLSAGPWFMRYANEGMREIDAPVSLARRIGWLNATRFL